MLNDPNKKLQQCKLCGELFTLTSQPKVLCSQNPNFQIDALGRFSSVHVPNPDFNVLKFINFVKEKYRISWKEMYWKVASFNYSAQCRRCGMAFLIPKAYHCKFHTEKPMVGLGDVCKYKCCGMQEPRFFLIPRLSGCQSNLHDFDERNPEIEPIMR